MHSFISGCTTIYWDLAACFQFRNVTYTVRRTPWTGDQPFARQLPHKHRITPTQTSMPRVEFEPTNPAFERAKTVHVLDSAGTVIGLRNG
jgi:hypothetical protein